MMAASTVSYFMLVQREQKSRFKVLTWKHSIFLSIVRLLAISTTDDPASVCKQAWWKASKRHVFQTVLCFLCAVFIVKI